MQDFLKLKQVTKNTFLPSMYGNFIVEKGIIFLLFFQTKYFEHE